VNLKKIFSIVVILLVSVCAHAKVDYEKIFSGEDACYTEIDNAGKVLNSFNPKHCSQRVSPNSTFKIPLTYISFEEKVFATVSTPIPWDHKNYVTPQHNQNQTPQSWISDSVVWVSRIVTRKVGKGKLQTYINKLNYGNKDINGGLEKFWLDSSLKISADEQVQFLKLLWNDDKIFSAATREKAKKILFVEKLSDGTEIYGKTGTGCLEAKCSSRAGKQHGWFVGVMVLDGEPSFFALNMTDKMSTDAYAGPRAKEMFYKILEARR
jgi:beta-lactamase class D